MQQYIYPVVFFKKENGKIVFLVPDLNLTAEVDNLVEGYVFSKEYLRVYLNYALKYDIDFNMPSKLEKIIETNKNSICMYVDATIVEEDLV